MRPTTNKKNLLKPSWARMLKSDGYPGTTGGAPEMPGNVAPDLVGLRIRHCESINLKSVIPSRNHDASDLPYAAGGADTTCLA